MDERLVTIAEYASYIEAEMAKQLLADYGIEALVIGEKFGLPYPIPSQARLQVFENQAKRAQKILESNEKREQ